MSEENEEYHESENGDVTPPIVRVLNTEKQQPVGSNKFEIATFNRIIPDFDGNSENLKVFLSRCESYN